MNTKELIDLLRSNKVPSQVMLPKQILFSLVNKCLFVKLEGVCENMQEDKSAFEGWIICIKSWLPGLIDKVEMDWEESNDPPKIGHYNRFIFRVLQFSEMFEWFSYPNRIKEINDFKELIKRKLVINYPSTGKRDSISERKIEDKIESLFVNSFQALIKGRCQLSILNQQLPVGVFFEKKSKYTRLFTGQKSAIDLWGIKEGELSIFELKYENPKVGIISELLFYLGLMRAVFLNSNIDYPEQAKTIKYRDFDKLYGKKFTKLKGYFLVDKLHPFIDQITIDLLNKGLSKLGSLSVEKLEYIYDSSKNTLAWK